MSLVQLCPFSCTCERSAGVDRPGSGGYFGRLVGIRIKICGITRVEDALLAAEAGADALGFMFFAGSPRSLSAARAREITGELPPFIARVGVFVNAGREEVLRTVDEAGINVLQFHGDESPEFCASFSLPVMKALRVKDAASLEAIPRFGKRAILLDAFVPGQLGGSGTRFNWDLAVRAKEHGRPIVLAGGLTPENVQDAIGKVTPYGVDVSSGVESAPGVKDAAKVREFIQRARAV